MVRIGVVARGEPGGARFPVFCPIANPAGLLEHRLAESGQLLPFGLLVGRTQLPAKLQATASFGVCGSEKAIM